MNATLRIESLAAGGDGVGRSDGLAVFVPRTAPGDVVDVELQQRGRFARGRVLGWRERSSDRVEPPCVHYTRDRCGGCQLQHLSADAQHAAKSAILRDALARIGKVTTPVSELHAAPASWRYRISLTLAIRRAGDMDGSAPAWTFGLRDYEDPERVFDLEDCLITDQRVLASWREVRAAAAFLPHARRLRGTMRWLGDSASFALTGGRAWPAARQAELARSCRSISVAHWTPDGATRRVLWDHRAPAAPPALSFTQVNPAVARELHADVVRRALARQPRSAIDAYSGVGETAQALADAGVVVTAVEVDRDAATFAAARLTPPSRSVAQRVERVIERVLPADVVVLNPPRAGVDASVLRALEACTPLPRAIIYVSCDPATLGRDVARLTRFQVSWVKPYDMFPQTAHVETLCELVPRS